MRYLIVAEAYRDLEQLSSRLALTERLALLSGMVGDPKRPWDTQEFRDPDDLTELDDLDAAELLREDWQRQTTEYDDYDEEDEGYGDDDFARSVAEEVAPFSRRQFPGLA